VSKEISARFGVSQRRAAFIARDQVAKLNGDLTRLRQTDLGIDNYIWRTSLDERVRPGHAQLEGMRQSWDKPPIVDPKTGRRAHPGGDFNCRCTAEPDIESIEGIDAEQQRAPVKDS
jgi:SPP1 gp7 family putative phage head morphogenesis protein